MKLPERLEKVIDTTGIIIALVVDLIVIPICMVTIAPDLLTKIAFLCIGVTIVLFVFRSWAKGQKCAWLIFAATVFFFDFSFALIATQMQTHKKETGNDAEIVRIDTEISKANAQIIKLQEERTISTRPETIQSISKDIETENTRIREYGIKREAREKELKKSGGIYITADSVFNAIPQAIQERRYIPLTVFGLIFLGLQMVIVTSIDSPKKKKREETKEEPKAETVKENVPEQKPEVSTNSYTLDDWITWAWYGAERREKPIVPSLKAMEEYAYLASKEWDTEKHIAYIELAEKAGLIDTTGKLTGNAENARNMLKGS